MYGFIKNLGKHSAAGWLNPYFCRTPDGNTEYEHYSVISETNLNEMLKDVKIEFVEPKWP